jgi:hypothetical protein
LTFFFLATAILIRWVAGSSRAKRETKPAEMTGEEREAFERLWRLQNRLEERVTNLETILMDQARRERIRE